jgi:micrococcal nuclease
MARLHPLRISVFVLMTAVIWRPLAAEASPALPFGFQADATVEAVAAIDGDTLELSDGRLLRLAAIQAPKAPLGFDETKSWPLEDAGRAALGEFALGRRLSLVFTGPPRDRYGRLHAQVFDDEGGWIQAALLAAGLARVVSTAETRAGVSRLLAAEKVARAKGRGIWALPFYRVLTTDQTGGRLRSFQIVEGQVLATAVVRGRGYLNFGPDWRSDFTASLEPGVRRLFEREGIEISDYEGLRVRVRGWLTEVNGPMIEITHPEQIEVIE